MKFKELQTPCFIIDRNKLDENLLEFKSALCNNFSKGILSYSVKTNSLPYVLSAVKDAGCFAEVVSGDEYDLARLVGFKPNEIIYNGPMKTKKTFIEAISEGAYVNIETFRELQWLDEVKCHSEMKIGVRVNINISGIDTEPEDSDSRFGFSTNNDELKKVVEYVKGKGIERIGLHVHRTSKTRSLEVYKYLCKMVADVAQIVPLAYVDIGGGFYGKMKGKPDYIQYTNCLYTNLKGIIDVNTIPVIIEPGNAIIASPVEYMLSVIDKKNIDEKSICLTDGTRNDIDPLFHKTNYQYSILSENKELSKKIQVLTGCTCLEFDRILELKNEVELSVDDKVMFQAVGAYTLTLTPNFIRLVPNVYAKNGEEYKMVRAKWTVNEWAQKAFWEGKDV